MSYSFEWIRILYNISKWSENTLFKLHHAPTEIVNNIFI